MGAENKIVLRGLQREIIPPALLHENVQAPRAEARQRTGWLFGGKTEVTSPATPEIRTIPDYSVEVDREGLVLRAGEKRMGFVSGAKYAELTMKAARAQLELSDLIGTVPEFRSRSAELKQDVLRAFDKSPEMNPGAHTTKDMCAGFMARTAEVAAVVANTLLEKLEKDETVDQQKLHGLGDAFVNLYRKKAGQDSQSIGYMRSWVELVRNLLNPQKKSTVAKELLERPEAEWRQI